MTDVALDARQTSHMSVGMQQYTRELIARLPRIAGDLSFSTFAGGDNFDWDEQIAIPLRILRERPRLVHFTSPYAPLAVPARYVVTIHDLIHLHYPQWTKPAARWYYRVVLRRTARAASAVIVDDARTANDVVNFYGVDRERVVVIPLGVDVVAGEPMRSDRPYAIYAGNRRPHKDLTTLLEGWKRLDPSIPLDLVFTGESDAALGATTRERGRVRFLGTLEHAEVMRWIAGARVLVHPALVEGFGLPLLEAARLQTPVIACESAVPEPLVGHVRTFPAGDADALARALEAVIRTDDPSGVKEARDATATLTWDRCAQRTADLYRNLLARGRSESPRV